MKKLLLKMSLGALACLLLLIVVPEAAHAQSYGDDTCSSSSIFEIDYDPSQPGLVTETVNYIRSVVMSSVQALFIGISSNPEFRYAAMASATLAVAIYGALFMFGIVPLTMGQALSRFFKIAFVMIMISPLAWSFFTDTVYRFFDAGTDEIILLFVNTSAGVPMPVTIPIFGDWLTLTFGVTNPFWLFDGIVAQVLSPRAITTMMASMTNTGPFGAGIGLMIGAGTGVFIMGVLNAMRIYCVAIIAKGLLFGIAPIMFVFLLFDKTKQMFTGWVNQLVNFSLQPILMFAFLSFYIILIESSYNNMMEGVEICWAELSHVEGAASPPHGWVMRDPTDGSLTTNWSWEGAAECLADSSSSSCSEFPISIINILTFLFTAYLGWKLTEIVPSIAIEIAGSSLMLNRVGQGGGSWNTSGGGSMMGKLFSN